MTLFPFWVVCCVVVGVIANGRGRSGFGWFLFSLFLSPLIGLIVVMCLDRRNVPLHEREAARVAAPPVLTGGITAITVIGAVVLGVFFGARQQPSPQPLGEMQLVKTSSQVLTATE